MSTLVKICGLREPDNIREVIALNPDLIGLIFHPGSPRFVGNPAKLDFLNRMDAKPLVAGVFVNADRDAVNRVNDTLPLDVLQLHGNESPAFCASLHNQGYTIIKAFGIHPQFDFADTEPYKGLADYFLFDNRSSVQGGSGQKYDWNILSRYQGKTPWFLSGGLSPDSSGFPHFALMAGIDLNSRFESEPGIKDIGLLNIFLKRFRDE